MKAKEIIIVIVKRTALILDPLVFDRPRALVLRLLRLGQAASRTPRIGENWVDNLVGRI